MVVKRPAVAHEEPDLVPIIDVVFFLLVFVLLNVTLSSHSLRVDLPTSVTAEKNDVDYFIVTVRRDGTWFFDDEPVGLNELQEKIKHTVIRDPAIMGVVQADRDVPYELLVQVMDVIRLSGVERVGLAADFEFQTNS